MKKVIITLVVVGAVVTAAIVINKKMKAKKAADTATTTVKPSAETPATPPVKEVGAAVTNFSDDLNMSDEDQYSSANGMRTRGPRRKGFGKRRMMQR